MGEDVLSQPPFWMDLGPVILSVPELLDTHVYFHLGCRPSLTNFTWACSRGEEAGDSHISSVAGGLAAAMVGRHRKGWC